MGWFDGIPGLQQMEQGWHQYNKIRGDITIINESDLTLQCYNNHAYQIDHWGNLNRTIHPGESFDLHIEFYAFPQTVRGDTRAESDYKVYFQGKEVGELNLHATDAFIGTRTGKTDAYILSAEPYHNIYRSNERTNFKILNGSLIKRTMFEEFEREIEGYKKELERVSELIKNSQGQVAQLLQEQGELNRKMQEALQKRSKYF